MMCMVDELEHKYEVEVKEREGRQKLPDDVKAILKEGGRQVVLLRPRIGNRLNREPCRFD